jgi:hypothetical protein
MSSKQCRKCMALLPATEFYAHPRTLDGRAGKCKSCTCADVRANRKKKLDYYRYYDRARATEPQRRANLYAQVAKYEAAHPDRKKATNAVNNAVRDGRLSKWPACAVPECANPRVVAHHPDYSKPLDVVWLCQGHHKQAHLAHTHG